MERSQSDLNYQAVAYFTGIHILGLVGLWYAVTTAQSSVIWFAVAYFFFGHLAITCGAHRLYSHESYKATLALQYAYVLGFSAVAQGPLIWWVGKHREHHAHTDEDADPHSPLKNFFHGHMGWLLTKRGMAPSPGKYVRHFSRDGGNRYRPAIWQMQHYRTIIALMAFGVPTLAGGLFGDWIGGLFVGAFARLMLQYHLTWIVNSAGHRFGTHRGASATNIWLLAIPTVGESFHANHHVDPGKYRLGRYWYDIDLGYYLIEFCIVVGLADRSRKLSS